MHVKLKIKRINFDKMNIGSINGEQPTPDLPDVPDDPPYVPQEYTVYFDWGDVRTMPITEGTSIELPQVQREGYEFTGWHTEGGVKMQDSILVTSDLHLYAHWTPIEYVISYNMGNIGSVPDGAWTSYTTESPTYSPDIPQAEGYEFIGWTPSEIPHGSVGDVEFMASWFKSEVIDEPEEPEEPDEPPEFSILTFDGNGNGRTETKHILRIDGQPGTVGALPSWGREGYQHTGWFDSPEGGEQIRSATPVDHDMTIYAQWRKLVLTIRYFQIPLISAQTKSVEWGQPIGELPIGERPGYTFNGWSLEGHQSWNFISLNTIVKQDMTLYANYTPIEYAISYDMNGHGVSNPNNLLKYTVETGEYTPEPLEDVEGWRFEGWTPTLIPEGSTEEFIFTANWYDMAKLTRVKYTQASGLPDWEDIISGEIKGHLVPTKQIPNVTSAKEIYLGSYVTHIGSSAFRDCYNLTNVTIPNSVTSIGNLAFYNCSGLTSVTIPASVTSVGTGAFADCQNMKSFIVDNENSNFLSANGLLLTKDGKGIISGINGDVTIPEGVTSIGRDAFSGCSGLTSVAIPDSVTRIGEWAFICCVGLTNLTMPASVTSIENSAFSKCTTCRIFDFRKSTSVPTLSNVNAFQETPSDKEIIVPDSLYDSWITAPNWSSTSYNIVNCIVKASDSSLGSL